MDRRTRTELSELAARIMAESGLDWLGARTKAARRLGVAPGHAKQVEESDIQQALRLHQKLYDPNSGITLLRLRRAALHVMNRMEAFHPRLHGDVAEGVATEHTPIELSIHLDSEKELESFLLNADISFDVMTARKGELVRYRCDGSDPVVVITANIRRQNRETKRAGASGVTLTARQLEALLATSSA